MAFLIPEVQHYFIRADKHLQFLLPGNGFTSSYLSFHNDLHWSQGVFCCCFFVFIFALEFAGPLETTVDVFHQFLKTLSQFCFKYSFCPIFFLLSLGFKISVCWLSYYFLSVLQLPESSLPSVTIFKSMSIITSAYILHSFLLAWPNDNADEMKTSTYATSTCSWTWMEKNCFLVSFYIHDSKNCPWCCQNIML